MSFSSSISTSIESSPEVSNPFFGYALIDKPSGWTSHDVVAKLRKITNVKKIGHAGTLDPLATGLLIVLIGREWTKRAQEWSGLDKQYEVEIKLGYSSPTLDVDGEVARTATWQQLKDIKPQQVTNFLQSKLGEHTQVVPAYSAVKKQGKKLYELARVGKLAAADLPARQVNLFAAHLLDFIVDDENQQVSVSLHLHCSAGFYVRSFSRDLGDYLEVGAVVNKLRRTAIGSFSITQAVELNNFDPHTHIRKS